MNSYIITLRGFEISLYAYYKIFFSSRAIIRAVIYRFVMKLEKLLDALFSAIYLIKKLHKLGESERVAD